MQQKIHDRRTTAGRRRDTREAGDAQLAASARLMGTALMLAWRALNSHRAARASRAASPIRGTMPRMATKSRMSARSRRPSMPGMPAMPRRSSSSRLSAMPRMSAKTRRSSMPGLSGMSRRMTASRRKTMPQRVADPMRGISSRMGKADMTRTIGGAGMVAAAVGVAAWMAARPAESKRDRAMKNRWMMVTINCSPVRLASPADLPEPIIRLGDAVDIKICQAPGDKGTELGARLRDFPRGRMSGPVSWRAGAGPRRAVREALHQAKSIIEAEEVLRPDVPSSTRPTPAGKLLEFAGRRGGRL